MKYIVLSLFSVLLFTSCKTNTGSDNQGGAVDSTQIVTLQNKVKQLQLNNAQKDSVINQALVFFNKIETNLSKISIKEHKIRVKSNNPELSQEEQEWILQEIANINFLRKKNAQNVRRLKKQINAQNLKIAQLVKMKNKLVLRIQRQDATIDSLRNKLAEKDMEYSKLFDEYQEQVKLAYNVMKDLNTVYFAYGTEEELINNGVIQKKGGFLGMGRKTKVASDLNQKYFKQLDKTEIHELTVVGKKPEMITDHPASSYKWEGNKLIILNQQDFWKVSNYLIIVVK